ncbi:cbb3-type cytochrome oxidase assembly protein CcoS [Candidatus Pelagibacter bacterium nBUS_36]|jgi:cbb3-type cytochrome oxidase maturation protein|uniref:cbb3-type cytochrome oxidase assembly protein CcoS n=1 Tax=Candidatus Pelagibacter bacterium nBUS_36 TaxID=3374194 RepID=UPI003EBE6E45
MNILLYLIPIALTLGLIGLLAFLWTLKNNQYEDLEGASERILIEEEKEKNDKD